MKRTIYLVINFLFFFSFKVRLYAPSRLEKLVPEKIFEISNFHPSHANAMEDMMKYKIVVVTLVTAGKLASAGKFLM